MRTRRFIRPDTGAGPGPSLPLVFGCKADRMVNGWPAVGRSPCGLGHPTTELLASLLLSSLATFGIGPDRTRTTGSPASNAPGLMNRS